MFGWEVRLWKNSIQVPFDFFDVLLIMVLLSGLKQLFLIKEKREGGSIDL